MRPGVADEHGKPYEAGVLDDLFGVMQQTSKAQAVLAEVKSSGSHLPLTRGDGSLKLRGGKAHASIGGTPAAIVNAYGSGGAGILLNFAPSDFLVGNLVYDVSFTDDKTTNAIRGIVRGLLAQYGITPEITMEPQIPGCHVFRHGSNTGTQLVSLIWDAPAFLPGIRYSEDEKIEHAIQRQKTVKVCLPEVRHVYRVFGGGYIGHTDTIEQIMHPGDVQLFAVLPYQVDGIGVNVQPGRDSHWTAQVKGGQGLHMLRVELIGPDGWSIEHYAANATARAGKAEGTFALALNDPPGTWLIRVRDVATGVVHVEPFEVPTSVVSNSGRLKISSGHDTARWKLR